MKGPVQPHVVRVSEAFACGGKGEIRTLEGLHPTRFRDEDVQPLRHLPEGFKKRMTLGIIRDHIVNGNIAAARAMTKNTNNPVARIIDKGIQRIGKPIDAIERSMESIARLEMYNLERNLSVLGVISRTAPIFGFVGTLAGLMQLFFDINTTGEFVLNTIAGGLYVKLVTSISGLIIGLISFLGFSFLHTQIDKTANRMEVAAADFLDILQEPTK